MDLISTRREERLLSAQVSCINWTRLSDKQKNFSNSELIVLTEEEARTPEA
jgi:hypothetical protein